MLQALKYLRDGVGEYYYDLWRMALLNLFWFVVSLPFIWIVFVVVRALQEPPPPSWLIFGTQAVVLGAITLALAGPGTAAIYSVINRVAHGELLEPSRFWSAFRHHFWRGWLLALADVGLGGLLVLNIWFYWAANRNGSWLLSIVFSYALVMWFAVQCYLFPLLVELNQSIRLVIRNALFLAVDNVGLTLGLALVNVLVFGISIPLGAFLLPLATMSITSSVNNKAVVEAIRRYKESGRIIAGER